jgi:hypothetical protein
MLTQSLTTTPHSLRLSQSLVLNLMKARCYDPRRRSSRRKKKRKREKKERGRAKFTALTMKMETVDVKIGVIIRQERETTT